MVASLLYGFSVERGHSCPQQYGHANQQRIRPCVVVESRCGQECPRSAIVMNKIVGIDLGTTNSLVATVDSGIPLVSRIATVSG